MAQIFAAFGKFGSNNKGSIQNFGIVGITVATEELTKFIFFFCPCSHSLNEVYGSTFMFGPAAVLLIVGYVVNKRTWRLMTGMCNRTQGVGRGCKRVLHFLFIFTQISMKAILAPATWLVIAFLKGDYYACAAWPRPDDPGVEKKFNLAPNTTIPPPCTFGLESTREKVAANAANPSEIIARDLRAYSHMIGWWFLAYALLIGVVFLFIFRCMSKYSYEQGKYIEKYRAKEDELFEEGLDAKAAAQAKIIVDQYFSKPRTKEEWDQIASINDKVMKSKRGRPIYSPMHKFVNKELVALELAEVDIVSDAAKKKHHLYLGRKKKPANGAKPAGGNASAAAIPLVAMSSGGGGKTIVQHVAPPLVTNKESLVAADQAKKNAVEAAKGTEKPQAQQSPPGQGRPTAVAVEQDPIEEANPPEGRMSLMNLNNEDEDPIKEATLSEHPDYKRSMEQLAVNDNVLEITEDGDDGMTYQNEQADSEPLLT